MNYVLIDETTSASQLKVTAEDLGRIAQACTVQLNRDFGPFWGRGPGMVRVGSGPSDIQPGEVVVAYVDALPEAPGAIAYHSVDGKAAPVIFVAVSMCNSVLSGPNSVAQATSHEILEAEADPAVNEWYDGADGYEYAGEVCDGVESGTYDEHGVSLSDFLLPSFFDPGSAGPRFSFLGRATAPLRTAPGGYQVRRKSGAGTEQQVNGKQRLTEAKRAHWSSRAYRRGLRAEKEAA